VKDNWLSTILKQLAINRNRGTQQEFSVSIKLSKEILPFQQSRVRILNLGVRCKNDSLGFLESESDEQIRLRHLLRLLVFLGIRLHPNTSDSCDSDSRLRSPDSTTFI